MKLNFTDVFSVRNQSLTISKSDEPTAFRCCFGGNPDFMMSAQAGLLRPTLEEQNLEFLLQIDDDEDVLLEVVADSLKALMKSHANSILIRKLLPLSAQDDHYADTNDRIHHIKSGVIFVG